MGNWCRDLYRVHATILQDEEEKVVVEESFEFKATTSDEVKASSGEASESEPSSDFEKWVIKGEQSINIFLTVNLCSCQIVPFTN